MFKVCESQDGEEAVQKARELQPDLIVLDVSMPLMNGLDEARAIRGILPAVPLMMYSSFVNEFAKGAGARDWRFGSAFEIRARLRAGSESTSFALC